MNVRLFYTLAWLACALCVSPQTLAHAFTYAQQLARLEEANRAFEQALISPTPDAAQGYYQRAWLGMNSSLPLVSTMPGCIITSAMCTCACTILDTPSCTTGVVCAWSQATASYRRTCVMRAADARTRSTSTVSVNRRSLPQLFFWSDTLSVPTQWTLALGGYALAWVAPWRIWSGVALPCAGAWRSGLCLPGLRRSTWCTQSRYATRAGVIMAEEVVVRKGNGESYTPQLPQPLHAGTEFVVLEERGSWLAIQLNNGINGWIRRDSELALRFSAPSPVRPDTHERQHHHGQAEMTQDGQQD